MVLFLLEVKQKREFPPPDNMKTLSTSLCTKVVAAAGANLSFSSYKIIIFPNLFFCVKIEEVSRNAQQTLKMITEKNYSLLYEQ